MEDSIRIFLKRKSAVMRRNQSDTLTMCRKPNGMTELKEIIRQHFAFLKISASPLIAHCQIVQANTQFKACQIVTILPIFNNKHNEASHKI